MIVLRRFLIALLGTTSLAVGHPAAAEEAGDIARLEAQIKALQAQIDELKKQQTASKPTFKAAPEQKGENGFAFKMRGMLQYDAGYAENPSDAVSTKDLGFNSRFRRARIGVEGSLPGSFGYKLEADFANNSVSLADAVLEYAPKDSPFSLTLGHHQTFQSLEQMTSARFTSFMERAQMNEAFGYGRRLGISAGFASGDFRVNAGLFNDSVNSDLANDDWLLGARATYSPAAFGGVVHLGANYQHRAFQSNAQGFDYRARPFLTTTGTRFVGTGSIAAESDDVFGVELAGVWQSLHVAGEAQWAKVDAHRPGFTPTNGDAVAGRLVNGDPGFFGAYAEIGYWLTGETRGYKNGRWDRTKVKHSFDKGGWGAFQINARVDYLDLRDRLADGVAPANIVDGGTQTGYLLGLVWQPIDYIRFIAQYARSEVDGGPKAAAVAPDDGEYSADVFGLRAQFDY